MSHWAQECRDGRAGGGGGGGQGLGRHKIRGKSAAGVVGVGVQLGEENADRFGRTASKLRI